MRRFRLILILAIALGVSPGLVWRNGLRPPDHSQRLVLTPLAIPQGENAVRVGADGPVLTGAWQMHSPNTGFGSYSALVATGESELLAISDRGQFLRFPMPGHGGPVALGAVLPGSDQYKTFQDMESVARDPATGCLWLGLEFRQAIMRLDKDLGDAREVAPPAMHKWRLNGGAESFTRLADGRFAMLSESPPRDAASDSPRVGLLFGGDPVEGGKPLQFRFVPPDGYDPSDMAQLPDGRMLILLRGLTFFPPGFKVRLVLADPNEIRAGKEWRWRDVGRLAPPIPIDNYEGLAVTGGKDGAPLTLWLVSDDNSFLLFQRSLLLRFTWRPPPRT